MAISSYSPSYHIGYLPYSSVLHLYDNYCKVQYRFYTALFSNGVPKHIDGNKNATQWARIYPDRVFDDDVGTFVFIEEIINKYDMLRDLQKIF